MIHPSSRALIALTLSLTVMTVSHPAFAAKATKPGGTKIGMKYEGRLRGHICKWGESQDLECYGLLGTDREPGADS